jgi:hypothetical protein
VDLLAGGETFGMLLQPLDTEQLAADGVFLIAHRSRSSAPEGAPQERFQWIPAFPAITRGQPKGCDVRAALPKRSA